MENNEVIEWNPDDSVPELVTSAEKQSIRKEIIERCKKVDSEYIFIARDLYFINTRKYYKDYGFERFEDYVEEELSLHISIGLRQVQYYISTYVCLVNEMNIPIETVGKIGISKGRILKSVINEENKDSLVDAALSFRVSSFQEYVKKQFGVKLVETKEEAVISEDDEELDISYETLSEKIDGEEIKNISVPLKDEDFGSEEAEIDDSYEFYDNEEDSSESSIKGFRLNPKENGIVFDALGLAKKKTNSANNAINITYICQKFLESYNV